MNDYTLRDLFWKCPECGQIISDLRKRSLLYPNMPCKGCNGSIADYTPLVGFPRGGF